MAGRSNRDAVRRMTLSAMLLAMMLILGWVEALLPLNTGVPGIKLGLSNGVLIFAVYMLDIPTAYILMALKVLLSGLMFSGVSAMLYGLCGGLVSLTGMVLLSRMKRLPIPVVGVAGGVLHNAGQVALSMLILNLSARAMLIYLLWLTLAGGLCGFLTGTCARLVMRHTKAAGLKAPDARKGGAAVALLAVLLVTLLAWQLYPRIATNASDTPETTAAPVFDDGGHGLSFP